MKFKVYCYQNDEGIFKDLFRANRALFKSVMVRDSEKYPGMKEFLFVPMNRILLNEIYHTFEQEASMGTEFTVAMAF